MDSSRLWWFKEYICETGFDRNTPHVFRSDIHSDPRCDTVHWNEASIKPSHLGYVGWVTFFLKNQVLIWWLNSHGIEYMRQNLVLKYLYTNHNAAPLHGVNHELPKHKSWSKCFGLLWWCEVFIKTKTWVLLTTTCENRKQNYRNGNNSFLLFPLYFPKTQMTQFPGPCNKYK